MTRGSLAASVVSLVVLLMSGTANATPTWLAPQDISAEGAKAESPQVALDAAGNAVAVWQHWVGDNRVIGTAFRPAGAGWQRDQDLSDAGADAQHPQIDVNPAGDAVAVWYQSVGSSYSVIEAAVRPAGGRWAGPEELSGGGVNATVPQVALDQNGNALAVWERLGPTPVVQASIRAGGAWSAPQNLSSPGQDAEFPQVAFGPNGNAAAVWQSFNGSNFVAQSAVRSSDGGRWGAPQDLSAPGKDAKNPQVAMDGAGNALAVWERFDGANWIIQAAGRPPEGTWSSPEDLSAPGQDAHEPEVAVDGYGNAWAIWSRSNGAHDVIQAAERPFGRGWGAAEDLSAAGHSADVPLLVLDPVGDAIAVWRRSDDGSNGIAQAALRPANGNWGAIRDLSDAGEVAFDPDVAVDAAGNGLAAWMRFRGGVDEVIQAAGLDAAGPVFDNLLVPRRGVVGRRLTFSVRSFDVWSPLAEAPHWTFGDGTSADGWRVQHAYAFGPASFPVEVSESDAVGNQTSFAGEDVSVAPAPCVVPRVVGLTLAKAKAAIRKRHCRPGRVARAFSGTVRTGRVVAQHPKARKRLPSGARVDLVVSRGRRP
ncbi:MAG TPA: PASTA domain-containing protein [Gaiellaceae bacterium]